MNVQRPIIRFKDHEQASAYMRSGNLIHSVPMYIEKDGQIAPNPEHESAPFELGFICHPEANDEKWTILDDDGKKESKHASITHPHFK